MAFMIICKSLVNIDNTIGQVDALFNTINRSRFGSLSKEKERERESTDKKAVRLRSRQKRSLKLALFLSQLTLCLFGYALVAAGYTLSSS